MAEPAAKVEMVGVVIRANERVNYHTTCQIPKAAYTKYLAMCEANARDSDFEREFADYIRFEDAASELGNDIEDLEIELA